jgi:hypothetical protein
MTDDRILRREPLERTQTRLLHNPPIPLGKLWVKAGFGALIDFFPFVVRVRLSSRQRPVGPSNTFWVFSRFSGLKIGRFKRVLRSPFTVFALSFFLHIPFAVLTKSLTRLRPRQLARANSASVLRQCAAPFGALPSPCTRAVHSSTLGASGLDGCPKIS